MVGIDTLKRMLEPKYYDSSKDKRNLALQEIDNLDHRFTVFGRQTAEGFMSLADLYLPAPLSIRCVGVTCDAVSEHI